MSPRALWVAVLLLAVSSCGGDDSTEPGPTASFHIDIVFLDPQPTDAQKAAFFAARDRWQKLIIGDLPDYAGGFAADQACVNGDGTAFVSTPAVPGPIDDVVIFAAVRPIPPDGGANILAQAGPCQVRGSSLLPIAGVMIFDSEDIGSLTANASLADVVTHEMGHVLGFGLIWSDKSLLAGSGGSDPVFTGANAKQEYRLLRGNGGLDPVPVENSGDLGTRDGHWRESVFGNELMTGYFNSGGANPLSRLTVASMRDLGYTVSYAGADRYALPSPTASLVAGNPVMPGREQLAPWPIRVADDGGRTLRVLAR